MGRKVARTITLWLRSDGETRRIEESFARPHRPKEATVWREMVYLFHGKRHIALARHEVEAIMMCMKELDTEA